MENCIFCKIIKGEIPSYKIYEDDNTYAFLDISNDILGHTLVVPKKHYRNIFDIPEDELNSIMKTVKLISLHYKENCSFDGVNILNNNEACAEQSVFHLHFHILPRKDNDGVKFYPTLDKKDFDLNDIHNKLKIN